MAQGFEISVSDDRLEVQLTVPAGAPAAAADVLAALRGRKIVNVDEAAITALLNRPTLEAVDRIVVTGTPAVDEKPSRIDFRVPMADGQTCLVAKVDAEQIVGQLFTGTPGVDGQDVFGSPVLHRRHPIEIGKNIKLIKNDLVAIARGNLHYEKNRLSIEPLWEIADKDPRPPAKVEGDAIVRGSLLEGTKLHVTGVLSVVGAIEAMQLTTGGATHAKGGIIGKNKGHYEIGGDLKCRFISAATIRTQGNIEVLSEIVNSRIDCLGALKVAHGPICGGEIAANGGITCKTLGTASGAPTLVEAGPGSAARQFVREKQAQIDANRQRYATVRSKIEPLMRILKQLTPQQRERVTELLSEADELETTTDEMTVKLETYKHSLNLSGRPEVNVSDVVHAGVVVRLGDMEAAIPSALKGPLCITQRKVGGVTEIVLVESDTGETNALPSRSQYRQAA